jgi:two-component system sensor histidine kinase DesK
VAFLLFIGFPIHELLTSDVAAWQVVATLAGLAAFVGLYLWLMFDEEDDGHAPRAVATLGALAAALSLEPTGAWGMLFIYVAAAAGLRLPARTAGPAIFACAAAALVAGIVQGYPNEGLVTFAIYPIGIGYLLLGFARMATINRELAEAREELAHLAVARERLRFARDLHDLLGHSLSVVALKSQLGRRLVRADPAGAERELADIEQVTRDALSEVREAVRGYRRTSLDEELTRACSGLAAAGIATDVRGPAAPLPDEVDELLAWTVREGATNVIRHSAASRCSIAVHASADAAEVEIADDGVGAGRSGSGRGFGLAGLRERADARGGRLDAGPAEGGGFRLRVQVPVG